MDGRPSAHRCPRVSVSVSASRPWLALVGLLASLGVSASLGASAAIAQHAATVSSVSNDGAAPSDARGDGGVFAAAMITCTVASTGLASLALVPGASGDPYAVYVVSSLPGAVLAHVDLLACPAIAMALAGPSNGARYGELVLDAGIGLLAGTAAGALLVWPVDQASLGRPPAATLAMIGAFALGSIGTTIGAIVAYELDTSSSVAVSISPRDDGAYASVRGTF